MQDAILNFFTTKKPYGMFWEIINSQGLATFISALVVLMVAKYGAKTAEALTETAVAQEASNASKKAQQLEDQENVTVTSLETDDTPASETARDNRNEASEIVSQAKADINYLASSDPDGRHQRTYDYIGKTDYIALAVALSERKQLPATQLVGAVSLFTEWKFFERGKASRKLVPKNALETFRNGFAILTTK